MAAFNIRRLLLLRNDLLRLLLLQRRRKRLSKYKKRFWIRRVKIQKQTTKMREPIGPRERLCVCLRYLVTGDAQITIATSYRMSPAVVGRIINETCEVLWKTLIERGFLKQPCTEEWRTIASELETYWNFPHCLGALDGKHVVIQAPSKSGSTYFNYKKPLVSFSWPYATHITNSL